MTNPARIFKVYKKNKCKHWFFVLLSTVLAVCIFIAVSLPFTLNAHHGRHHRRISLEDAHDPPAAKIAGDRATPRNARCTHWTCFDIYKCGHDRIGVYVYPLVNHVDDKGVPAVEPISEEYYELLEAILESKYYEPDPGKACIFVPSIDTLNQERLRLNLTSRALHSLPYWNGGQNHLIFNMIAGASPDFSPVLELDTGSAMLAGAGFDTYTFREGFDIPIPIHSPVARLGERTTGTDRKRTWLLTSSQPGLAAHFRDELQQLKYENPDRPILILDACESSSNYTERCDAFTLTKYEHPQVLGQSTFCTVFRGERLSQFALLEAMAADCIPVVVMNEAVMPFKAAIDWKGAAVFVMEEYLGTVVDVLKQIGEGRVREMRRNVRFYYRNHLGSMKRIAMSALDAVQDRIYPHWSSRFAASQSTNPLFFPTTAPKSHGFTAVILTYDRVESLFILVERLSKVPSLMKVIVVWNNQKKSPPPLSDFPAIAKPIKVIKTKANKLSNRFRPFRDIETEAVLHIDDDIVMLTPDELEFAYEAWREFPDRIVGFPSRWHRWDNATMMWRYESEWTNEISMVLTGAAFLHKYWSHMYTNVMPAGLRDWVDEHMNCEDIAMNFLVANVTNKPPIKVTPRKKFKCPECVNNEMLSADLGHMVERTQCINKFVKEFGRMPLKSVEFRADPVLFKDPFPEKLKRFNDIGSL